MWVQEGYGDKLTLPIPGEADITAAGCEAHAVVTREPGVYTNGAVKVEVFPKDTHADRRLVFMQDVDVNGGSRLGMQVSHCVGKSPVVTVPDPTGRTPEVTLSGPVVEIRGPWKVRIPLDAG